MCFSISCVLFGFSSSCSKKKSSDLKNRNIFGSGRALCSLSLYFSKPSINRLIHSSLGFFTYIITGIIADKPQWVFSFCPDMDWKIKRIGRKPIFFMCSNKQCNFIHAFSFALVVLIQSPIPAKFFHVSIVLHIFCIHPQLFSQILVLHKNR